MSAVRKAAMTAQVHRQAPKVCHLSSLPQQASALMAALPGGAVVILSDGCVGDCNAQALDMLGAPLLHEVWSDVIARAFVPRADDGHEVSLRDGRRIRIVSQPLPGEDGQLIQLIDLTESRSWQAKVAHQQRVNALGRMAASLAHQLRTPLSSATLYAAHLQNSQLPEATRLRFADQLVVQLHVMEGQIRTLMLLARQELPLTDRMDISSWMKSWKQRLQDQVQIRVQGRPGKGCFLMGNRLALDEALVNLLRNAEDVSSKDKTIDVEFAVEEQHVMIRVSDQGCGMDSQQLQAIEQPFYTSKIQGTGLGLALVRTIMAAHGGRLEVVSNVGQGSTFSLVMPVLEEIQR
ncbi:MAG: HAMP domain-containing histidine kinase [Pseudomonadales bacterium]|nr:HAMP domain-containing histidine kinase [Pseudomonadales bacterium]